MHSALQCLFMLARWHGLPASPQTHAHAWDEGRCAVTQITELANDIGLKAKAVQQDWRRMAFAPLPAIAALNDGAFCVVAQVPNAAKQSDGEYRLVVQRPGQQAQLVGLDAFRACCTGVLVYVRPRRSLLLSAIPGWQKPAHVSVHPQPLSVRAGLAWFMPALMQQRGLLIEIVVVCIALQLLALLTPLFFQVVTDKVLVNHAQATLQVVVVGLILSGVFETVFSGIRSAALARLSARLDVTLGQRIMRHLLALPMAYFAARRAGDTLARVREAENIRAFLTGAGINAVLDLIFALLFTALLFFYSTPLSLLVLLSLFSYAAVSMLCSPLLQSRTEERFLAQADSHAFLTESLNGIATIKTLAIDVHWLRQWNALLAASARSVLRCAHTLLVAQTAVGLISRLLQVALLWWGAQAVMNQQMSVGELIAFNMLSSQVSGPVLRLSQLWNECQQLKVSLERMCDIFAVAPEGSYPVVPVERILGAIRFENVFFRYRIDMPYVLQDVSFDLKPGDILGIVGASGSGKSTITQLVQGLHSSSAGRVLIDGHDISTLDRASLRRQTGVVMQESLLFNRSIRDNIAIAVPDAPLENVMAVARLAGAHEFIAALPDGYQTVVGEQGTGLSGGQRQRVAIARALLKNPRILIFDEATSALDLESELAIHSRMRQICANRTVIIIAHRLTAVRHAQHILVMRNGRILESGLRERLLNDPDSRFHQMHQMQMNELA